MVTSVFWFIVKERICPRFPPQMHLFEKIVTAGVFTFNFFIQKKHEHFKHKPKQSKG